MVSDGPGGAQHFKLAEGMQTMADRLAAKLLQAHPARLSLHLRTAVTQIEHSASGVVVTAGAERFACDHVVLALPPPVAGDIRLSPPEPGIAALCESMRMGAVIKTVAVFDTAFWRVASSAAAEHYTTMGPVYNVFDATFADRPALVGLIVGDMVGKSQTRRVLTYVLVVQARKWAEQCASLADPVQLLRSSAYAELREAVLEQYKQMYQLSERPEAISFVAKSWINVTSGWRARVPRHSSVLRNRGAKDATAQSCRPEP